MELQQRSDALLIHIPFRLQFERIVSAQALLDAVHLFLSESHKKEEIR